MQAILGCSHINEMLINHEMMPGWQETGQSSSAVVLPVQLAHVGAT
jgi:hypothetical protein